jgi:hypothetical protein
VTLFKHTRWKIWCRAPFGRWLVPVERSGNMRQQSSRSFRISDEGGTRCRGIAGETFVSEQVISAFDLPDLSEGYTEDELERYAREAYVDPEWLRRWVERKRKKGQKVPRAICGYPVETAGGKIWGVIVLDSTEPADLANASNKKYYDVIKKHLSRLVERV